MSREEPLHVHVETRSDDVLCPECNERMRKDTYPGSPMSVHGLVGCDNAGCPVHEEQKLVSWSYRTSVVTSSRTIPAAKVGAPSHVPLDKEPDGESES